MSYDIWLELEGMQDERPGNYTYNVDPMFALALDVDEENGIHDGRELLLENKEPSLARFRGRKGDECLQELADAIAKMEVDPERFQALNPSNGWGDYDGALNYLCSFFRACKESPSATVVMWL